MKVYKIIDLEIYTVAFNKKDAMFVFFANRIAVTVDDIEETDIDPNRDAIGEVFRSLDDLNNHFIEY